MKTKEELNALKEEVETLNRKLAELTEDELRMVIGGIGGEFVIDNPTDFKEYHIYTPDEKKDFLNK